MELERHMHDFFMTHQTEDATHWKCSCGMTRTKFE